MTRVINRLIESEIRDEMDFPLVLDKRAFYFLRESADHSCEESISQPDGSSRLYVLLLCWHKLGIKEGRSALRLVARI